jgi:hypothetical protein
MRAIRVIRTPLLAACVVVGVSQMVGCATPSNVEAMVPDHVTLVHRIQGDVAVSVTGNRESSSVGASEISNEAFAQALSDSIAKSALFSTVQPAGARSRYQLVAFISKADQQMEGRSQTVRMKVSYQLLDAPTGNTLWAQNIESTYAASEGGYLAVVRRLRLANEGAARENIRQALAGISTLEICHSTEVVKPAAGECPEQ